MFWQARSKGALSIHRNRGAQFRARAIPVDGLDYLMFDGFHRVLRVLEDFDCNFLAHVGFVGYVHRCRCTHAHALSHLKCATHFGGHFVPLSSLPQDDFFSTCKCCQPVSPRYLGLQTAVLSSGARKVSLHQIIIVRAREGRNRACRCPLHTQAQGWGCESPLCLRLRNDVENS